MRRKVYGRGESLLVLDVDMEDSPAMEGRTCGVEQEDCSGQRVSQTFLARFHL